jgi:addiction module antidote-like protein
MSKISIRRYDVAEHLRTPEEMAAYLEACLEEADGDAAFVAKALGDIARAKDARLKELIEQLAARVPFEDISDAEIDREVQAVRDELTPPPATEP